MKLNTNTFTFVAGRILPSSSSAIALWEPFIAPSWRGSMLHVSGENCNPYIFGFQKERASKDSQLSRLHTMSFVPTHPYRAEQSFLLAGHLWLVWFFLGGSNTYSLMISDNILNKARLRNQRTAATSCKVPLCVISTYNFQNHKRGLAPNILNTYTYKYL